MARRGKIKELNSMDETFMRNSEFVTDSQGEANSVALPGFSDTLLDDQISNFFKSDVSMFERKLQDMDSRLKSKGSGNIRITKERLLLEKYCDEIMLNGEKLLTRVNNRKTAKQVKQCFRKMISHWISKNPFINRGLLKPRGYPGDYMMMQMGYDNAVIKGASGLNSELDRICYKRYQAIPRRKDKLKEVLRDLLEKPNQAKHLKILTLGGGPCREWLELDAERRKKWGEQRVELTYLDQDDEATEFSRRHLIRNHLVFAVEYRNESLLSFIRSSAWESQYKKYDLVYILGVGDYLGDSFLTNVIVQGLNLIKDSGKFEITQKDRMRFPFTFLDWFCDWAFVRRNKVEFNRLLQEALSKSDGKFKCEIIREDTGQIMFGIITRL